MTRNMSPARSLVSLSRWAVRCIFDLPPAPECPKLTLGRFTDSYKRFAPFRLWGNRRGRSARVVSSGESLDREFRVTSFDVRLLAVNGPFHQPRRMAGQATGGTPERLRR